MPLVGTCNPTGSPAWTREGAIGDYGGATDKRASETEGTTPYAATVYRELQAQRGSAYSKDTGNLVHVENLALARTLSAVWFRLPERYRANALPHTSDERLEYWATVLGIPFSGVPRWRVRQLCAAHYRATLGPTLDNVTQAVSALLGDAFVQVSTTVGTDLDNPPDPTKWPGVNPGGDATALSDPAVAGQGSWFSTRCHLVVEMTQPSGMSDAEFINLRDVQLTGLLDRMLPAWATFGGVILGPGFLLTDPTFGRLSYQGLRT